MKLTFGFQIYTQKTFAIVCNRSTSNTMQEFNMFLSRDGGEKNFLSF